MGYGDFWFIDKRFTGSARFFFANPNYKDGFYMAFYYLHLLQ